MKIDLTSMAFGYSVLSGGATPNWATSLGQSFNYKIEETSGIFPLFPGLVYCAIPLARVKVRKGKGGNTFVGSDPDSGVVLASLFRKVFVNSHLVPDGQFLLYIDRDASQSHSGRLRLKYSRFAVFTDNGAEKTNDDFLRKTRQALSLAESACWFVHDISICNQDELHLAVVVVDPTGLKEYGTAADLKAEWTQLIPAEYSIPSPASTATAGGFDRRDILAAIRTKPFILLAGISGTGKSRMVRQLARGCCPKGSPLWEEQKPGNFEMIQVRPNWHDSTELLGYVSRISGTSEYQLTPFVRFLAKAWLFKDIPFFLCLDEMNLAPVEQYFAEYLSVIETRKRDGGKIRTDPLVILPPEIAKTTLDGLFDGVDHGEAQPLIDHFIHEGGIPIPPNLVVMGTVNMDETTFSFSRKVLDRAMSFELNEVDFAEGLGVPNETEQGSIPAIAATPEFVRPPEFYGNNKEICDAAIAFLEAVNAVLEPTPFKIAYRTRDEVLLYCVERLKGGATLPQALDEAASMKILSRIEGDQNRKDLLEALNKTIREQLAAYGDTDGNCKVCSKKIGEMLGQLKNGAYTSFWTR